MFVDKEKSVLRKGLVGRHALFRFSALVIPIVISMFTGPVYPEDLTGWKALHPEAGRNFILNGDFETGPVGVMPKNWGRVEYWAASTTASVETVKLDEGNQALCIRFLTDGGCVINYLLREKNEYFSLRDPAILFHSLRVKNLGNGRVYGVVIDPKYATVSQTEPVYRTDKWQETFSIVGPKSGDIGMVRIYIKDAKAGDVYFIDDYILKTVTEKEAEDIRDKDNKSAAWMEIAGGPAGLEAGKAGNILNDSSFESTQGAVPLRYGTKWWTHGGEIVRTNDAPHGEYVINRECYSDPCLYCPDIPYTFSFFAKAPEGSVVKACVVSPPAGDFDCNIWFRTPDIAKTITKTFQGTGQWTRYSFSFIPRMIKGKPNQVLTAGLSGDNDCFFDAVQLEEGALTDYRPQKLELFTLIPRRKETSNVTLFFDKEKIPVIAVAQRMDRETPESVAAEIIVNDFWENTVRAIPLALQFPAKAVAVTQEVALSSLPRGVYRVYIKSGTTQSRSVAFGIVGRYLAEGSEIAGGSHETGLDFNRAFIEALGLTWTRHHAAYWGTYYDRGTMPADGKSYDWSSTEKEIAQKSKDKKLRFWGSVAYPPDPWTQRIDTGQLVSDPKMLDEFLDGLAGYMALAVGRFKDVIKYWECWNEPSEKNMPPLVYLPMLKRFYKTVKSIDPNAVVIGGCPCSAEGIETYILPLIKMGAANYLDVISYHSYLEGWPEEKISNTAGKTLIWQLAQLNKTLKEAGAKKDLWDNEFWLSGSDWYTDAGERVPLAAPTSLAGKAPCFNYRTGAAAIVHLVTIEYAYGVRHFGLHCFDHDVSFQFPQKPEYDMRAFSYDYAVKPKAISYAVICNKLNGAKIVDRHIGKRFLYFVFEKPGNKTFAVLFARKGEKARLELENARGLDFRNIFDDSFPGVKRKWKRTIIELTGEPVYIETDRPAGDVASILRAVEDSGGKLSPPQKTNHGLKMWLIQIWSRARGIVYDLLKACPPMPERQSGNSDRDN